MRRVLIIGGGAAGMMAAIAAAEKGAEVTLLEQNERPVKRCLLQVKEDAILPMPVTVRSSLKMLSATVSFCIVHFIRWTIRR